MTLQNTATILAFLIFALNIGLWTGGFIGATEFPIIYKVLPPGLQDQNGSPNFQDQLNLVNDSNQSAIDQNATTTNFLSATLTFIEAIPVLGSLITLFRFSFDFIGNATFGITLYLLKINTPIEWVIAIGALNFVIITFGILGYALQFTAARGGRT